MRVAIYYSNSDVRIEDQPKPEIGADELLLRVEAVRAAVDRALLRMPVVGELIRKESV